jgi:integrase
VKGSVFKRCSCAPAYSAKGERLACKSKHGSWSFVADAGRNPATGHRRQIKRGGFPTKAAAEAALAELVDQSGKGMATHDERQTVAAFLRTWLDTRIANGLRPKTAESYRQHIEQIFIPAFGHLRLRDLRPGHVEAMLAAAAAPRPGKRARGPASIRRIHATLRSALGTAVKHRLIPFNPAVGIDLPKAPRPRVKPWEPSELGSFLDYVASDRLGALYELIAATGLRRGEAVGLRWDDVDLERGVLVVRQQIVSLYGDQLPACPYCGEQHRGAVFGRPKTASGEDRVVELDGGVVGVLLAHRLSQDAERAAWADAHSDHGLVFAREDGRPIVPSTVTKRFGQLSKAAGVSRNRVHGLRHGQASLMLAAGVPISVVSKRLGHSTVAITSDTYSHLLEGVGRDAAERAAALIPRASRAASSAACDQSVTKSASGSTEGPRLDDEGPGVAGLAGAASGNRTPDNLITSRNEHVPGEPC